MRTVLWASLVLMLHTPPSFAHPLMVGYADIAITDREVEVRLSVNLSELDQLMSLDANRNGEVEGEELAAKATQISDYLRKKVQVRVGDAILPMEAEPFRIRRSLDGKPTLEATLRFRSVEALETFTILCEPLTELGADHTREQQASAPAIFGAKVREGEGEKGAQRDDDSVHDVGPLMTSRTLSMNRPVSRTRCRAYASSQRRRRP